MRLIWCAIVALAVGIGGCEKAPSVWDRVVVGPDLDTPGPFVAAHNLTITGDEIAIPAADPPKTMRIELTRGLNGDSANLIGVLSDSKSYLAGVTYHAFVPVIAEINAQRFDYWSVGFNLTRTPDRSIYALMRFPHGTAFAPGSQPDGVEYALLSCDDLDFARRSQYPDDGPDSDRVKLDPAPAAEAGDCEFNSRHEADTVTPVILRNYDRVKHLKDAPALAWQSVTVSVN